MDIEVAVVPDEETFTGLCKCGYFSKAWPSHEVAAERILQHKNEHETGELMEDQIAFRERHGLVVNTSTGRVVFPDNAVVIGGDEDESEE